MEWNRYICACGATGFRKKTGGVIVPHKQPRDYNRAPMMHVGSANATDSRGNSFGRRGKRGPGGW